MSFSICIDFETRSEADLYSLGAWKYAAHPSTEVMCLAVKRDDRPTRLWVPDKFKTPGRHYLATCELVRLIQEADRIEAHNMEFERAIWRFCMSQRLGIPDLDLNKCDCTAARAAAMALPRKLETVCEVLRLSQKKDGIGHALMMKMCKPRPLTKKAMMEWLRKKHQYAITNKALRVMDLHTEKYQLEAQQNMPQPLWCEEPEQLNTLFDYCIQDVETEHELSKVVRPLSAFERQVWLEDQRINERGVYVDLPSVTSIIETLDRHEAALLEHMKHLTDGLIHSPRQSIAMRKWLGDQGVEVPNIQKQTVEKVLLQDGLPQKVRDVLSIRRELGMASTSKFKAMQNRADSDSRCRGLFMYAGAATGRWTSKAVQLQNMVRDGYHDEYLELAYDAFESGDIEWLKLAFDDPFKAASRCLRGVITAAPGHEFLCGDYASIEARGNAWQAGDERTLQIFRDGVDIYKIAAGDTFGVFPEKVNKDKRQIGKVQVLSLGYQGGIGAFAAMAKNYGLDLAPLVDIILPTATSDELDDEWGAIDLAKKYIVKEKTKAAEGKNANVIPLKQAIACDVLKRRWRKANPFIVQSWKSLEEAAITAVDNPGQVVTFNKAKFRTWRDKLRNNYLLCQLPSGRILYYFEPQLKVSETPWGTQKNSVTCRKRESMTGQWVRRALYGGLLCENCLAGDTEILTPDGWIHLDSYIEGTPVWDGEEFVYGGELLDRGVKHVIEYNHVRMTGDHKILCSDDKWRTVNEITSQCQGLNRKKVRLPDYSVVGWVQEGQTTVGCTMFLRENDSSCRQGNDAEERSGYEILRVYDKKNDVKSADQTRHVSASDIRRVAVDALPLPSLVAPSVSQLRSKRHLSVPAMASFFSILYGRYVSYLRSWANFGSREQQRGLRQRKLSVGEPSNTKQQPKGERTDTDERRSYDFSPSVADVWCRDNHNMLSNESRVAGEQAINPPGLSKQARVYDIQNCGPRHRFVVKRGKGEPFIVHNCVQGLCRDPLAEAMPRVTEAGYPVVLHVHDELLSEIKIGRGSLKEFCDLMAQVPKWAAGLPISVEGWAGKRYRK